VLDGGALWNAADGATSKSCADCHGDARLSMKGVAARYPAIDRAGSRPVDIATRVNICRAEQQKANPLPLEGKKLLAISSYISDSNRAACRSVSLSMRAADRFSKTVARCSFSVKVSLIFPVLSAMMTIGDRSSLAHRSHRGIPPDIRCIAWSGNPWDRYNGDCEIA
jgi:hypothetical protein